MICMLKHFIETVEDPDIASILQKSLELSESHVPQLSHFFTDDQRSIPKGFTESDVNLDAPRLYSDVFMLHFISQLTMMGLNAYGLSLSLSARKDVTEYFAQCLKESINLHGLVNELMLKKGLYIRSPHIPKQEGGDFVTNQKFLGGWINEKRPLVVLEITNLYANIQRNMLGSTLMCGFSQVAGSEQVRKYMERGKEIASKHVEVFSAKLKQDDLPASVAWNLDVTQSTTAPFSDKLMLAQTADLTALGIGYYGTSMSTSLRKDITADYVRLTAEISQFAAKGAQLLIDNGWMEEPPQAVDRKILARETD